MNTRRALGVALLWLLLAFWHLLLWVGSFYPANHFSLELKVSASGSGEYIAEFFNAAHSVLSWPASSLRGMELSDMLLIALVAVHCLAWGAVWLLLFAGLQGAMKRGNAG